MSTLLQHVPKAKGGHSAPKGRSFSHFDVFNKLRESEEPKLWTIPRGVKSDKYFIIKARPDESRRSVVDDVGSYGGM